MKKALLDLVDVVRHLMEILKWKEIWVMPALACCIVGFWLLFAFSLTLPNPWKSVIIWAEILGLAVLAPSGRSISK